MVTKKIILNLSYIYNNGTSTASAFQGFSNIFLKVGWYNSLLQ